MILTGTEIAKEVQGGNIVLRPFNLNQINPNSYNYRLGPRIKIFSRFDGEKSHFRQLVIPKKGLYLKPCQMYLSHTLEIIGSKKYAMSLVGRSSMGRLGLFLQLSANLGHTASAHQWTLELYPVLPIKLYPGMVIGQVTFWTNYGEVKKYDGIYGRFSYPQESFLKRG